MRWFDRSISQFPLARIEDYRELAQKKLPAALFAFLESGAFGEITLRNNQSDFDRILLKRRILRDVSNIHTSTQLFGKELPLPLLLAPIGFAGCFAGGAEISAAKAASAANIPMILSAASIASMEEVTEQSGAPCWLQFSPFKEKSLSLEILQRATQSGCKVLVITADLPIGGSRHRYRHALQSSPVTHFIDELLHLRWWLDVRIKHTSLRLGNLPKEAFQKPNLPAMRAWTQQQIDPHFSWKDLDWIRANWPGKVVIKGILDPLDAKKCEQYEIDGIVVSNHGARHLDGTLSTIGALPRIRDAVKTNMTILIDGGVRSGLDLIRALALGADACLIGKPWIYGVTARGEVGVQEIIALLHSELKLCMAHLGLVDLSEIHRGLIESP